MYWQAFDVLEPIGMLRENAFQANIAKSVLDAQIADHGLTLEQFMLWHGTKERSQEDVIEAVKARLDALC